MNASTSPSHAQSLLVLGHISKAHGIRGELAFYPAGQAAGPPCGEVHLFPAGRPDLSRKDRLLKVRPGPKGFLLTLASCRDRNSAETLRGLALAVARQRLPGWSAEDVFLADLPGFSVFETAEQGPPTFLGSILEAGCPAGQELWLIKTSQGHELYFPAVPEFVLELDPKNRSALIAPPPGLLESQIILVDKPQASEPSKKNRCAKRPGKQAPGGKEEQPS